MGKIYESAVFLSLRRNLHPDEEIGYWKDQSNFEVDFVTRKGLEVESIIQVSPGEVIKEREFRAGIKAAKEFNMDEVLIIGDNEGVEKKDGITLRLIPLRQWLL